MARQLATNVEDHIAPKAWNRRLAGLALLFLYPLGYFGTQQVILRDTGFDIYYRRAIKSIKTFNLQYITPTLK